MTHALTMNETRVPVILETDGRTLHLRDATQDLFIVPGTQVSGRVTRRLMDLEISGKRYIFTMFAPYTGDGFTDEMQAYLRERGGSCAQNPGARVATMAAGSFIPGLRLGKMLSDSSDLLRPWQTILPQLGATLR